MVKRTRLPTIELGRRMWGDAPSEQNPKITFDLETDGGEIFEASFSLPGILSTVVMAYNWPPLKEALAELAPPTKV
jgi:hypothetical protein